MQEDSSSYLGMDPFCTDVFIDDDLVHSLGADVEPTEISLTTMLNVCTKVNYNIVRNVEVLSLDCKIRTTIESAYSKPIGHLT